MIRLTIIGEPVGKSSGWKIAWPKGGRPFMVLTQKGRSYKDGVIRQVLPMHSMLVGPLKVTATLYYASERPDLDPSLLLDALQKRIYKNDRQVRELHVIHAIDRKNPRAEVTIEPMQDALERAEDAARRVV